MGSVGEKISGLVPFNLSASGLALLAHLDSTMTDRGGVIGLPRSVQVVINWSLRAGVVVSQPWLVPKASVTRLLRRIPQAPSPCHVEPDSG